MVVASLMGLAAFACGASGCLQYYRGD
jgi:hypothetical protein